ncbi:MAG: hypothetical protein ACRDVE_15695 [Actinocrinis sp.]
MSYDVLAVRAQRQEAAGVKPWPFHIGGDEFEFPAEVPDGMLAALADLAKFVDQIKPGSNQSAPPELLTGLTKLKSQLLAPADAERLESHQLSINDTADLLMTYFEQTFGGGLGESAASPSSSPPTPTTPRRTSKRTTKSTSRTTTAAR